MRMKNFKSIRRLLEQAALPAAIEPNATASLGLQPEAPETPEMPIDYPAQQLALPAEGQASAPVDPMTMTVGDFINKCKENDPLVAMGIESYVEKNRHMFGGHTAQPAQMMTQPDQDLTFSAAVAPQDAQIAPPAPVQPFSLDQSQDSLNFPG